MLVLAVWESPENGLHIGRVNNNNNKLLLLLFVVVLVVVNHDLLNLSQPEY